MSRGSGRLERRVLALLESAPERRMTREELEPPLVDEGYRSDNILRSIRSLARVYEIGYFDARLKGDCVVSLPRKAERISDEDALRVLREATR